MNPFPALLSKSPRSYPGFQKRRSLTFIASGSKPAESMFQKTLPSTHDGPVATLVSKTKARQQRGLRIVKTTRCVCRSFTSFRIKQYHVLGKKNNKPTNTFPSEYYFNYRK